ncbi:hypothetical protein [Streptomyces sp. NPDC002758]
MVDDPQLPRCGPEPNPAGGIQARLKSQVRTLVPCDTDGLLAMVKTKLKRIPCRPGLLDGFIAETGLIHEPP